MRRTLFALPAAAVIASMTLVSAPVQAAAPARPSAFTSVTARPGPRVGEITLRWSQAGLHTTGYVLETGLTAFSKTSASLPRTGRQSHLVNISRSKRTLTLSAAQVAGLDAPVGSGNHLYFRLAAVNKGSGGTTLRYWPYLQAVLPKAQAPSASRGQLKVASFNIRTARATSDSRSWTQRAPDVARTIVGYGAGLVALQELGPGRADGKTGTLKGTPRQTNSLTTALDRVGGQKYDLVRSTPYVASGTPSNTQGMRILYDRTKYSLVSSCSDLTAKRSYSSSCSIVMPLMSGDSEKNRRRAAYAQFQDRASGKRFFFVSVHLDARHSDKRAEEVKLDALRKRQADAVSKALAKLNTRKVPVIIAGDFNSWQNNRVNNSPHDTLVAQGYYDTSAAVTRTNFQYSTYNEFKRTQPVASQGVGVRLDMILVKGASGASRFDNVTQVTDATRPSDHNLVGAVIAPF